MRAGRRKPKLAADHLLCSLTRPLRASPLMQNSLKMKTTLPYDVWLRIAEFLQPATLRKLLSVNHAFFDIVVNRRYRDIHMDNLDRDSVHILRRLQSVVSVYYAFFHVEAIS